MEASFLRLLSRGAKSRGYSSIIYNFRVFGNFCQLLNAKIMQILPIIDFSRQSGILRAAKGVFFSRVLIGVCSCLAWTKQAQKKPLTRSHL